MERPYEERSAPDRDRVRKLLDQLPYSEAIPRADGEVAFDTVWEIRAFTLAVALYETNGFEWSGFQRELVAAIKQWEESAEAGTPWRYYDRWLEALENVLAGHGLLDSAELDSRTHEVLATPRDAEHQHAHRDPVAVVPAEMK